MPGQDLTQPLLTAAAGASAPWGSAQIQGGALATFQAQLSHGFALDLGLGASIGIDADLEKFISAQVTGEAHAEVRITGQVQMPMNLFDEMGLAVRLKLAAEAAAGVSLELGLSLGDFLHLVQGDQRMQGIPTKLFLIFLSEANIGGGLYAKAAASAMAYANLVISARAIQGPTAQDKPGFNFLAEMGAGLKAGAGFRVFASLGMPRFERFTARTIDLLVEETISDLLSLLPQQSSAERAMLRAAGPTIKMVLRNAYELGVLLGTQPVPATADGAKKLALRCSQVILEECQRYLLERIVSSAITKIQGLIDTRMPNLSGNALENARAAVQAFGERLVSTPDEPFQAEQEPYWTGLLSDATGLVLALDPSASDDVLHPAAVLWSGVLLTFEAMRRLTEPATRASFTLGHLNVGQAAPAFSGNLASQPPLEVRKLILRKLGRQDLSANLKQEDLIKFLVQEAVDATAQAFPDVQQFLQIFKGPLGATSQTIAGVLLSHLGAIKTDAQGLPDEQATLQALASGLEAFLQGQIQTQLAPLLRSQFGSRDDLRLYFDEVFLPAMTLSVELVFDRVLDWQSGQVDATAMKEALSSVLMMLVGRSLAVSADVLLAAAQAQMSDLLVGAADDLGNLGLVDMLRPLMGGAAATDVEEIIEDALRVGAQVFGPLPGDTRERIRSLLYEMLEPLPANQPAGFLDSLADAAFLPQPDHMTALSTELLGIAGSRLVAFIEGILARIGERLLAELETVVAAVEHAVGQWIAELDALAAELARDLANLVQEIAALVQQVAAAFAQVTQQLQQLLNSVGSSSGRATIRAGLVDAIYNLAKPLLVDNLIYAALPSDVQTIARNTLRSTIQTVLNSGLASFVWNAIGEVAGSLSGLLEDIHNIPPGSSLITAVSNLILDRIVDAVRNALGGAPTIELRFSIRWSTQVTEWDWSVMNWRTQTVTFDQTIDLGGLQLDLSWLEAILRSAIRDVGAFDSLVSSIASQLASAFQLEQRLNSKEQARDAAQAQSGEVAGQQRDNVPAERAIAIVEPSSGKVYDHDISLSIHFTGVPISFLGLGANEQSHLVVALNNRSLPLSSFHADESDGTNLVPRFRPGIPAGMWGEGLRVSLTSAQPSNPPLHWAARKGISSIQIPGKPGNLTPVKTAPWIPGLYLTGTLRLSDLEEGINTLAVVLVDGRGDRQQQTVTFLVAASLGTKDEKGHPKMPGVRAVSGKPAKIAKKFFASPVAQRKAEIEKAIHHVKARGPLRERLNREAKEISK